MRPHEVIVGHRVVFVQWDERGPYMALYEDGSTGVQWRLPAGVVALRSGGTSVEQRDDT